MYQCVECKAVFTSNHNFNRHRKEQHSLEKFECVICRESFHHQLKLITHMKKHDSPANIPTKKMKMDEQQAAGSSQDCVIDDQIFCDICNVSVPKKGSFNHKKSLAHKNNNILKFNENDENIKIINSAFKSRIINYRISDMPNEHISLNDFLSSINHKIKQLIEYQIEILKSAKINFELFAIYTKYDLKSDDDNIIRSIKSFNTKNIIITESSDLESILSDVADVLNEQSEEFQEKGSGWSIEKILFIEININKYNPLRAK